MMMEIYVKTELIDSARSPVYKTPGAAGADLFANLKDPITINPGERRIIPTGVKLEIPNGFYGEIHDRSGLAAQYGITVLAGVIDSDYRGEIMVVLLNTGPMSYTVYPGDRIAQLIIKPYVRAMFEVVRGLSATDRGEGGFGSTGK